MKWFYAEAGQQRGPVEDEEFRHLTASGAVQPDTLVWHDGMASWQRWDAVSGMPPASPGPVPASPQQLDVVAPVAAAQPAGDAKFCSVCGSAFSAAALVPIGDRLICINCKPAFLQSLREGRQGMSTNQYGGFWIRFAARLIDGIIMTIVSGIFQFAGLAALGINLANLGKNPGDVGSVFTIFAVTSLIGIGIQMAYEVYFLVTRGATPGKILLNLKVVRSDGGPLSTGRAVGRFFGNMLSSMTLSIGYIIAGIDDQKRALHDHLCDTRVIRTN